MFSDGVSTNCAFCVLAGTGDTFVELEDEVVVVDCEVTVVVSNVSTSDVVSVCVTGADAGCYSRLFNHTMNAPTTPMTIATAATHLISPSVRAAS